MTCSTPWAFFFSLVIFLGSRNNEFGGTHFMLEKLLQTLCKELSISPVPEKNKEKIYLFPFSNTIEVELSDLNPGVGMTCHLLDCPKEKREDLFIWIMRANLLGSGTGGCRIGLDANEKVLTLSLSLAYEINYSIFKERFEDFVNYVIYWREEISHFTQTGSP